MFPSSKLFTFRSFGGCYYFRCPSNCCSLFSSSSSQIEVEKKVRISPSVLSQLSSSCSSSSSSVVTDLYFDSRSLALCRSLQFLRERNGKFELKVPTARMFLSASSDGTDNINNSQSFDRYRELTSVEEISRFLGFDSMWLGPKGELEEHFGDFLRWVGYKPFVEMVTNRKSYLFPHWRKNIGDVRSSLLSTSMFIRVDVDETKFFELEEGLDSILKYQQHLKDENRIVDLMLSLHQNHSHQHDHIRVASFMSSGEQPHHSHSHAHHNHNRNHQSHHHHHHLSDQCSSSSEVSVKKDPTMTYSVAEVEIVFPDEGRSSKSGEKLETSGKSSQEEVAEKEIVEFCQHYGIDTPSNAGKAPPVRGKLMEYLAQRQPQVYEQMMQTLKQKRSKSK